MFSIRAEPDCPTFHLVVGPQFLPVENHPVFQVPAGSIGEAASIRTEGEMTDFAECLLFTAVQHRQCLFAVLVRGKGEPLAIGREGKTFMFDMEVPLRFLSVEANRRLPVLSHHIRHALALGIDPLSHLRFVHSCMSFRQRLHLSERPATGET